MKTRHIITSSLIIILSVALFSFSSAYACGCGVLITSSDKGSWAYGEDSTEKSFINLDKGVEKLIISLDIKNTSKDSVLVIPVPAQPATVTADILGDVPHISGYDVETVARGNITHIRDALLVTQIYPAVPLFLSETMRSIGEQESGAFQLGTNSPIGSGITAYQHLEKNGMIAEVLGASSSDALYSYLTGKGLKVDKDSIPIFRDYINDNFSFIVSWINPSNVDASARGILASFPATEMFYPLKPGSAYSGLGATKTITVIGHVSPKIYSDIKDYTFVNYLYSDEGSSFKDFFTSEDGFAFTKITIFAKPSALTQDLYISNATPLRIYNAQFINLYPVTYGIILLLIISALSVCIAAGILYRNKLTWTKLLGLFIASCLTLIGTMVGAKLCLDDKKIKYVLLHSILFTAITLSVWYTIFATLRNW